MAFLAHLVGGILCLLCLTSFVAWVPALIIYLTQKDKSRFAAFHSMQALILMAVVSAINCVLFIAGFVVFFITVPLAILLNLGAFVYALMVSLKAKEGEWAEYVVIGDLVRDKQGKQG